MPARANGDSSGQVAEEDQAGAPQDRCERQVVALDPPWESGYQVVDQLSFRLRQRRLSGSFLSRETVVLSRPYRIVLPPSVYQKHVPGTVSVCDEHTGE